MRSTVIFAVVFSCAQAQVSVAADDCAKDETDAGQRACLETHAIKTRGEVERLEGQLRSRITLWEQGPVVVRQSLALFEQDRAAYRAYREAHCALRVSSAVGGNDAGDMRRACEVNLDRGRIAAIEAALDGFDPGD
jgi:Lysozyme inhibitor LprI